MFYTKPISSINSFVHSKVLKRIDQPCLLTFQSQSPSYTPAELILVPIKKRRNKIEKHDVKRSFAAGESGMEKEQKSELRDRPKAIPKNVTNLIKKHSADKFVSIY